MAHVDRWVYMSTPQLYKISMLCNPNNFNSNISEKYMKNNNSEEHECRYDLDKLFEFARDQREINGILKSEDDNLKQQIIALCDRVEKLEKESTKRILRGYLIHANGEKQELYEGDNLVSQGDKIFVSHINDNVKSEEEVKCINPMGEAFVGWDKGEGVEHFEGWVKNFDSVADEPSRRSLWKEIANLKKANAVLNNDIDEKEELITCHSKEISMLRVSNHRYKLTVEALQEEKHKYLMEIDTLKNVPEGDPIGMANKIDNLLQELKEAREDISRLVTGNEKLKLESENIVKTSNALCEQDRYQIRKLQEEIKLYEKSNKEVGDINSKLVAHNYHLKSDNGILHCKLLDMQKCHDLIIKSLKADGIKRIEALNNVIRVLRGNYHAT